MRRSHMFLLAAALAILLLVPAASAGQGGSDRPFTATLAGAVTYAIGPGTAPSYCQGFTTNTHATGQVTHLGRVDFVSSHCPYDLNNHHDGYMTMIAANGDKLSGSYDYDPEGEYPVPVTITGGTGRFAQASGTVFMTYDVVMQFRPIPPCDPNTDIFGCLNPDVPWPWTAAITGTITY